MSDLKRGDLVWCKSIRKKNKWLKIKRVFRYMRDDKFVCYRLTGNRLETYEFFDEITIDDPFKAVTK